MPVDQAALLAALRRPGARVTSVEPLGLRLGSPGRVTVEAGGEQSVLLVRQPLDRQLSGNHIAVMEALATAGFAHAPRLRAVLDGGSAEDWVPGLSALAIRVEEPALGAAIDVIAALHDLPIHEGLRWGEAPRDLLPGGGFPLFRLGFSSDERASAAPWLEQAAAALAGTPSGFMHGALAANHLLFAADGRPFLVDFALAGFGAQPMDVAAFLLTAGARVEERQRLARRYAAARDLPAEATTDDVDLAGLLWGLGVLLLLPRRLVENLGDDVTSDRIRLTARRVEEGIRIPAGDHPAATGIRRALWGG